MTTFWRRQTIPGGNFPPMPTPSTGVPYFPITLPPNTIIGRLNSQAGPTEAIPLASLATFIAAASLVSQVVTAVGTTTINAATTLLIFNKSVASASPCNLPSLFARDQVELQIYDFTGLAGDITLTPFGTEKIMGANSPWKIGSGGVAQSGGALRLLPLAALPGWLVR